MKGKFFKHAAAMALALAMTAGIMPFESVSDIFDMSVNTYAADTVTGSITVDGKDYKLYSGFNATSGRAGVGVFNYPNLVDNDLDTLWFTYCTADIEFNTNKAIIPVGYKLITDDPEDWKPKAWKLYAKQYQDEDWTQIDEKADISFDGTEATFYCGNVGKYRYFRFEATASTTGNGMLKITELQLFGKDDYSYTPVAQKAATCAEVGIKQDCYMRDDGVYFADAEGKRELNTADVVIPTLPHTPVFHAATDTTIEYWQCSECHKYFGDSFCTEELTKDQLDDVVTKVSEITVDDEVYKLYSGFTATSGRTGEIGNANYPMLVDNNNDTFWFTYRTADIEFNTHRDIIPVGYKLITDDPEYWKPKSWKLYAKQYQDEDWTQIDEKADISFDGIEATFYCDNVGKYRYFRFEATASTTVNGMLKITELQLFGKNDYTYTPVSQRAATCAEVGIKQDCWLRNDGKYFADEEGTTELNAADVVIPMLAHTPVFHEGTDTTVEYWQCSECHKYFADRSCTEELTEEQLDDVITQKGSINVDGKEYNLYSGYTATSGRAGVGINNYPRCVDNDLDTLWFTYCTADIEFNTNKAIIPVGYKFFTDDTANCKPKSWTLYAKRYKDDDWTKIDEKKNPYFDGTEDTFYCDSIGKYRYFRFEVTETTASNNALYISELQIFGFDDYKYTALSKRAATCAETGISQDCYLRTDGKYFADENGTEELDASDVIIQKTAHTPVHYAATDEHIEYWQCSLCKRYFADAEMKNELMLYLDESGTEKQISGDYTIVTDDLTTMNDGWYVVNEDSHWSGIIDVSGDVKLLLCNNTTLKTNDGILLNRGSSLTIYAQTEDPDNMGVLNANSSGPGRSGIGGYLGSAYDNQTSITINGGKINAYSSSAAGIGSPGTVGNPGPITINGGIINAYGGNGAGIGGSTNGYTGDITINGGYVYATGVKGAGIGSAYNGKNEDVKIAITDNAKIVYACGSNMNDAIGTGYSATGDVNVSFLSGGTDVTSEKDNYFTDTDGNPRTIRSKKYTKNVVIADNLKNHMNSSCYSPVTGETVILTADIVVDTDTLKANDGAVTLNNEGNGKFTFVMPDVDVSITGETVPCYAVILPDGAEITNASILADINGMYVQGTVISFKFKPYYTLSSDVTLGDEVLTPTDGIYSFTVPENNIAVKAVTERNAVIDLSLISDGFIAKDGDILSGTTSCTVQIEDGAEITLKDVNIGSGIICLGSSAIVLEGTNTVNAKQFCAGIRIGGEETTLTIKGSGTLDVTGGVFGAAIGTDYLRDTSGHFGNIVIEGGNIKANGSECATAIGFGQIISKNKVNVSIGDIVIKGGNVTAEAYVDSNYVYGGIGMFENELQIGSTLETGNVIIHNGIEKVDTNNINFDIKYYCGDSEMDKNDTADIYFTVTQADDRYTVVSKDNTDKAITADANVENALVFSKNPAKYGERVTVSCKEEYFFGSDISVNDGAVAVEDNNDGTYSFRTPAGNVTVKALCIAYGDAGLDGKIDNEDAALVLKSISTGKPFFDDEDKNALAKKAANFDGKDEIDMLDVIKILSTIQS